MWCDTYDKYPETDIAVQSEDQRSKISKPLEKTYFYQVWVITDRTFNLCLLPFYINLWCWVGLKACDSLVLGLNV